MSSFLWLLLFPLRPFWLLSLSFFFYSFPNQCDRLLSNIFGMPNLAVPFRYLFGSQLGALLVGQSFSISLFFLTPWKAFLFLVRVFALSISLVLQGESLSPLSFQSRFLIGFLIIPNLAPSDSESSYPGSICARQSLQVLRHLLP